MSTITHTVQDSATMLRRDLRHQWRYLSVTLMLIAMPVVFLLLFVYIFGGTLGAGTDRTSDIRRVSALGRSRGHAQLRRSHQHRELLCGHQPVHRERGGPRPAIRLPECRRSDRPRPQGWLRHGV